ncbi:MarR family winged helix-turn-helix transcriptional regulator [Alkaliphilus crotonatoxidans]
MRNYYLQIHQYLERLVHGILILDKNGIKSHTSHFSLIEWYVLKLMGSHQEIKMYEMMEELDIDRNSFGTIINKLQAQKYIMKKKSDEDKRVQVLVLTEKGRHAHEALLKKEKELLHTILNDFSFNEEKAILKFLVKLDMLKRQGHP